MKVLLAHTWYAPDKVRYRKPARRSDPVEIPDNLKPFLPTSARIVPDTYVAPPIADPYKPHIHPDEAMARALTAAQIRADQIEDEKRAAAGVAKASAVELVEAVVEVVETAETPEMEALRRKAAAFQAELDAEKEEPSREVAPKKRKTGRGSKK